MLVDYSDSDDDDQGQADAAPAPAPAIRAPAPSEPPAKKQRKEINLQALLQKNDASLEFEDAAKLPDDFFDPVPSREPDASVSTRGGRSSWATLSAMLPAPKNAGKGPSAKSKAASLYANARPLGTPKGPTSSASTAVAAVGSAAASASSTGSPGSTVHGAVTCESFGSGPLAAASDAAASEAAGLVAAVPETSETTDLSASLPAPQLRPRVNTSMYDTPIEVAAGQALPTGASGAQLLYEVPAGPAVGPSAGDVAVEGYDEVAAAYGGYDLSEGRVMDIDQAALKKVIGQSRQYDFAPPPPPQEAKIAAGFWSRTSGDVVQHYVPSSQQKRKHQINSLAADAQARAADVALRSSKSQKSKRETAAKYGW